MANHNFINIKYIREKPTAIAQDQGVHVNVIKAWLDTSHWYKALNPLSPKIHKQILQTYLPTFVLRIIGRIWFKIKALSLW